MSEDFIKEYSELDIYTKLEILKKDISNEFQKYYYLDLSELRKYQKIVIQIHFALEEL